MEILASVMQQQKRVSIFSSTSSHDDVIEELEKIKLHLEQKRLGHDEGRYANVKNPNLSLSESQMRSVATLLPDEIIENPMDTGIRKFEAAVFFVDVSGFTELADRYQKVENGASKLTAVMNAYLGSMVQEIFAHKGDVIKYAGDAFIAIFKVEKQLSMQESVRSAIDTALIIQKNCKNYHTEVGVILNVKISIAAGDVLFSTLGDQNSSYFVVIGDPVWQSKDLQDIIKAGEVLVSNLTWFYVQHSLYKFSYDKEGKFYRILNFRDFFIDVLQRQHEAAMYITESMRRVEERSEMSSIGSNSIFESMERPAMAEMQQKMFTLRTTMDINMENESKRFLRRFVPKPLMKMIDRDESIENLAEMRDVVIMFTSLPIPHDGPPEVLIDMTNRAYTLLSSFVTNFEGAMNGVTLFDKGMMFLSIFGLRGQKHIFEGRVALRCAHAVHQIFKSDEWRNIVKTASIGVTSGVCYSGLIGHSMRRELTVMSVTVNKAARLMMAYPDIVSCDQETAFASKLDFSRHFKRLPDKKLKGIGKRVACYKFHDFKLSADDIEPRRIIPYFGRVRNWESAKEFMNTIGAQQTHRCLLIKGEVQEGRTRFLLELYKQAMSVDFKCIIVQLSIQHHAFKFYAMRKIVKTLMNIQHSEQLQDALAVIIGDPDISGIQPWLLNPILKTNFEMSFDPVGTARYSNQTLMMKNFLKLLEMIVEDSKCLFFIDCINFMDPDSLDFFNYALDHAKTSFVVTSKADRNPNDKLMEVLCNENVKVCELDPLSFAEQKSLIAECLKVTHISPDLEAYMNRNSKGNPGWIVNTLNIMKEMEYLSFDEFSDYRTVASIKGGPMNLAHLNDLIFRDLFDIDTMTFDNLSQFEQVLCKNASALGYEFRRDMLTYLMSTGTQRRIGLALVKFFDNQIFTCTSPVPADMRRSSANLCYCVRTSFHESCRDLPRTANCTRIKFVKEKFRDTIYATLTEKQRVDIHEKCFVYLHTNSTTCQACGSEPFAFVFEQEIDFKFRDGVKKTRDRSKREMEDFFESIGIMTGENDDTSLTCFGGSSDETPPVILNFAAYDFSMCECSEILKNMYQEMIKHCHGSNNLLKLIDTKIKFARFMLLMKKSDSSELEQAMTLLTRALDVLEVS